MFVNQRQVSDDKHSYTAVLVPATELSRRKAIPMMKQFNVEIGQFVIITMQAESEADAIEKAKKSPEYQVATQYNDNQIKVEEYINKIPKQ